MSAFTPTFEALEPRVLLSSDAGPNSALWPDDGAAGAEDGAQTQAPARLVLVDGRLASLADGFASWGQVLVLDASLDGLEQVTTVLAQWTGVSELHIVSHGSAGVVQLGQSYITREELDRQSDAVEGWRAHLAGDAAIYLYGCNVAQGDSGRALVDMLAGLTGVTVLASTDATGSVSLGGNLTFEYATGDADFQALFGEAVFEGLGYTLAHVDGFEPNNSVGAATNLGQVTGTLNVPSLSVRPTGDLDFFQFQTVAGGTSSHFVEIQFTHSSGDIDMRLRNSNGDVLASSTGTTNTEKISLEGRAAGVYYVEVYGFSGAVNDYSLEISAPTPATLTISSGSTTHHLGGDVKVDAGLTVGGTGTSTQARVVIQSGLKPGDKLTSSAAGVDANWNSGTGTLTLTSTTGPRDAASWQAVLRNVAFESAGLESGSRGVVFVIVEAQDRISAAKTVLVNRIGAELEARIKETFAVIAAVGQKITDSTQEPGRDDTTPVPMTEFTKSIQPKSIGSFLQLKTAVDDFFASGAAKTVEGLQAAVLAKLQTLVPGSAPTLELSATYNAATHVLDLQLVIATTRGFDAALSLGDIRRELNMRLPDPPTTITVGGGADVVINMSFNLSSASVPATNVTLDFDRLNALAGFTFSGLNRVVEVGVIRGQFVGAYGTAGVTIPVQFTGASSRTLNNWPADGSAFSGFGSLQGSVDFTLPISASIGGVSATTGATKLVVTDDDIFDDQPLMYVGTDFENLAYFGSLSVESIIQEILKVGNLYSDLSRSGSDLFGVNVPFIVNTKLGDLFDFKSVFDEFVGSNVDIYQPVLNTLGRDVLLDYRLPLSSDSEPKAAMWSDLRAGFEFGVIINNAFPVRMVTIAADNSRNTLDDLVSDVNAALTAVNVDIVASNVSGKMFFTASDPAVQGFALVPAAAPAARLTPSSTVPDLNTLTVGTAYYYTVTGTTSGTV
jgi:hypothetical protein